MKYFDKSLRDVLTESKAGTPTPGGGSVSAMVACFANAMVEMVANLTDNVEKYPEHQVEVKSILKENEALMVTLEELVDRDMAVFNQFMAALKLPKGTDEEKALRTAKVQEAYIEATEVPFEIAETCLKIIELTVRLCEFGNKSAISDVGVGALLAEAAIKGALLSVDINLSGIKDFSYVNKSASRKEHLLSKAAQLTNISILEVKARL